jgi:hypothetical protein
MRARARDCAPFVFHEAQEVKPLLVGGGTSPNESHGGDIGCSKLDVLHCRRCIGGVYVCGAFYTYLGCGWRKEV